jgi:hypothetical protein
LRFISSIAIRPSCVPVTRFRVPAISVMLVTVGLSRQEVAQHDPAQFAMREQELDAVHPLERLAQDLVAVGMIEEMDTAMRGSGT